MTEILGDESWVSWKIDGERGWGPGRGEGIGGLDMVKKEKTGCEVGES